MKVSIATHSPEAVKVVHQLMSPWEVTYTCLNDVDVSIVYGEKPSTNEKTIVIPSDSVDFEEWLRDRGSRVTRKSDARIFVEATSQTTLSFVPETQYDYKGSKESIWLGSRSPWIKLDDDIIVLSVDIIKEYQSVVNGTLNPKSSFLYRFLTSLPIPYTAAPRQLRNLLMRNKQQTSLNLHDKLPIDALRFLLAKALSEISRQKLVKKRWNGKGSATAVTHDIETYGGLKKAEAIKKLEEKYNVPSTWYIPSERYAIKPGILEVLANFGEVGAHDTTHDGKLNKLSKKGTC